MLTKKYFSEADFGVNPLLCVCIIVVSNGVDGMAVINQLNNDIGTPTI